MGFDPQPYIQVVIGSSLRPTFPAKGWEVCVFQKAANRMALASWDGFDVDGRSADCFGRLSVVRIRSLAMDSARSQMVPDARQ